MTSKSPSMAVAELTEIYESGIDNRWCSDLESKQGFCSTLGIPFQAGDHGDAVILSLLKVLPAPMRWAVEQRSGIWSGQLYESDDEALDEIGDALRMDSEAALKLYDAGMHMLRFEAAAAGLRS